jgi:membrane protein implicated in regulation of membrane protease activity
MINKGGLLIGAACAGACAIPLVVSLLAGASLATVGATLLKLNWEVVACGALALPAAALLFMRPRRPRTGCRTEGENCSIDGSCGCRPGENAT